jgi:ABC-type metal ion transport system substrate-binding protein
MTCPLIDKNYFQKTNFIKRNNVDEKDIVNVMRTTNDVKNLNQTY